jgi:hypothetical protein
MEPMGHARSGVPSPAPCSAPMASMSTCHVMERMQHNWLGTIFFPSVVSLLFLSNHFSSLGSFCLEYFGTKCNTSVYLLNLSLKQAKHIRKPIQISWNRKQALSGMMVQLQFWWVTVCMLQMLVILVLLFQKLAKVLHTGSRYLK